MPFLPQAPPPAQVVPAPKGVRLGYLGVGFDATLAAKRAAREMGATVVVEDEFLALPILPAGRHWGVFRWRSSENPLALGALPTPVWMDPSVTRSGGNVVNRVYGFGGVGF